MNLNWKDDLVFLASFWALYLPFSLMLWSEGGMQDSVSLTLIFAIGLVVLLKYVAMRLILAFYFAKKKKGGKNEADILLQEPSEVADERYETQEIEEANSLTHDLVEEHEEEKAFDLT